MRPRSVLARAARVLAACGAVAGASWLGVGIVGAHGGDATLVHGCVDSTGSHTIQVVAPDQACIAGQTALDWSTAGVTGAKGAHGPAGPTGPAGATGPPGRRGVPGTALAFETVTETEKLRPKLREPVNFRKVKFHVSQSVSVLCPDGRYAVGGGYNADIKFGPGTQLGRVDANEALPKMRGWRVELTLFGREEDPAVPVSVYAVCALVAVPSYPTIGDIGRPRTNACLHVCAPTIISRAAALRSGLPGVVNSTKRGSTITATVVCPLCRKPPPNVAGAAAARGLVIGRKVIRRAKRGTTTFKVRVNRRGKRALRSRKSTRLVMRVAVDPPKGRTRRSSARIRVRR